MFFRCGKRKVGRHDKGVVGRYDKLVVWRYHKQMVVGGEEKLANGAGV